MRKVLSFVLVLALVLGSFSMAFAADTSFSDMAGEKSAEAVSVLKDLGVVAGYPDGTFRPDQIVTRAEMARFVVAALGLEQFAVGTTSKYPDMVQAPWAQGYVAYGTSIGFISGYPDGTFKPNQQVSFQEAASMIVRALGYTEEFLPGGWPAEWMIKANSLGIFDDVTMASGAALADRGAIAQMIYNALELKIGYVDADNKWSFNDPTDTMLLRLGAKFVAADDLASDAAIIFGDEDTKINLRAYVGAYSDRYLDKNDNIIKVMPVSTFLTGEFNETDGVFEADNGTDYNVPSNLQHYWVFEFYNGVYTGGTQDIGCFADEYDFDTMTIAVKISGKTIKDLYSVSAWEVTEAFLFDDDYADQITDDQELGVSDFVLDDDDEIDLKSFELLGAAKLADIDEDNVVYVYANGDDIRKIEVGTEVVTGEVTKINSLQTKITVGTTTYELADMSDDEAVWDALDLEDEVEFYLDYAGYVYAIEIVEAAEGENYAVLLMVQDTTKDINPLSGSDAKAKLFLADGTTKVFDVDEDATSDLVTDGDWITPAALGGWVVEYGVDGDGVIDYIDLLANNAAYFSGASDEVTSKGYFDGKAINTDAVIFTYDGDDLTDDDNYGVTTLANIKGNDYSDVDYLVDSGKIDMMILWGAGVSGDDVYGVVKSFYQTTASDTNYAADLIVNGVATTYDIAKAIYDNRASYDKNEDLYMLTLNSKGEITALTDQDDVAGVDIASGTVTKAYGSGLISVESVEYTVDLDTVVYAYNSVDGVFKVVSLSKANLGLLEEVELYDTDEDGVTDTILVL